MTAWFPSSQLIPSHPKMPHVVTNIATEPKMNHQHSVVATWRMMLMIVPAGSSMNDRTK
jgi:hypothetical protein